MWAECDAWGDQGPGHPGGREELGDQLVGESEVGGWSVAGLAGTKVPLGEGLGEACQPVVGMFAPGGCVVCVIGVEVGRGF